jgi:uncharacterized protein (UPF0276 family)
MNRFGYPDLGIGLGLRSSHYTHILGKEPEVGWFEALSENYLDSGGRPRFILEKVAERYPVVLHGVSLSIGGTDPLDFDYLRKLKELAKVVNARWISDHLCWTGVLGRNSHDLLPVPTNEEMLEHIAGRVKVVSDVLERPFVIENPSSYVEFKVSTMSEWTFMSQLAERADCGLLLDVNNIFVSSFNHSYDPNDYVDAIPADRVVQIHLAGHTNYGTHIIDTHTGHVIDEVWALYERAIARFGNVSTMVEWDQDIPEFEVVHAEALKAAQYRERALKEFIPSVGGGRTGARDLARNRADRRVNIPAGAG